MTAPNWHASLTALGFSAHEIQAYGALLRHGPLTGYQLAKQARIPRPNIYPILDKLQVRGIVNRVQVKGGIEYAALPAADMLTSLSRDFQTKVNRAREAIQDLNTQPTQEILAWNIKGYDLLLSKASALMKQAKHRVLVGLASHESEQLSNVFQDAQKRGLDVVTLCVQGCAHECGHCAGRIYRYSLSEEEGFRLMILIVDDQEMLIGQIATGGDFAIGAYSTSRAMVTLAGRYLRNAIAVAEIVRSVGPRLLEFLDTPALEALQGSGLSINEQSLFDQLWKAVNLPKSG